VIGLTCCLNCIPLSPRRSGRILNRYESSPPTLSMVLRAPTVTLSLSDLPSASDQTALVCLFGSHVRRVLLLNVSPTALPDWSERPSYRPVWNRLGLSAEREVARRQADVGNIDGAWEGEARQGPEAKGEGGG